MTQATATLLFFVLGFASCGGTSLEAVQRSEREYDLARGLYEERDLPGTYEHLLAALELDPDNAEAHLFLGTLFIARPDYTRAEHHLREAIRSNDAVEIRAGLGAEARNSLGVLFLHAERYEEAIEVLREASSDLMNRTPEMTRSNLAWAYLELDRPNDALGVLLQAEQQSPNSCLVLYRLGQTRVARDEWEQALEALERLLAFEADECQGLQAAWRLRGEVHAHLGNRDGAIRDFERCVELSGQSEDGQACRRLLAAP